MKLQLDTTVSFHRIMNTVNDEILAIYMELKKAATSVHASTFTKKEFAFSQIKDCCVFQSVLFRTKSFSESLRWIIKYGYFKKRTPARLIDMVIEFVIDKYGTELTSLDKESKDKLLARRMLHYLRIYIPELWERFDEGIEFPMDDRTHCPFAQRGPIEKEGIFTLKGKSSRHPCNGTEGCTLVKMLSGKDGKIRAISLLKALQALPDEDARKTKELKKIQKFIEEFYISGFEESCYRMCNKGIGDMIIALETLPERILVSTNAKEHEIICQAISQNYKILSKSCD